MLTQAAGSLTQSLCHRSKSSYSREFAAGPDYILKSIVRSLNVLGQAEVAMQLPRQTL
jgi:hypothetical protein